MNFSVPHLKSGAAFLILGLLLGAGAAYAWSLSSWSGSSRSSVASAPLAVQQQKTPPEDDEAEAVKRTALRMEKINSVIDGYRPVLFTAADNAHLYAYLRTLSADELMAIGQPGGIDANPHIMKMALDRLFEVAPQQAADFAQSVAKAYTSLDGMTPQEMEAYFKAHHQLPLLTPSDLLAIWSMHDPAGALHCAASLSPKQKKEFYGLFFQSYAEVDPAGAFQAVNGLTVDPDQKETLIYDVTGSWASTDLAGCMTNFLAMPKGPNRAEALRAMLNNGVQVDPKAMLNLLAQNPGDTNFSQLQETSREVAQDDPALALDSAKLVANPQERSVLISGALQGWTQADPQLAWKYAGSQLAGDEQKKAVETITHDVAHDDPLLVSDWIGKMPDGPAKDRACTMLLFQWSVYEPDQAANWVQTLPDDKNKADQVDRVAGHWASQDPDKAKAWINSLPNTAERDSGNYAYAWQVASQDPTSALTTAATIADPALQQRALAQVYKRAAAADATTAQAWLQQSSLPDDEKQKILAQGAK